MARDRSAQGVGRWDFGKISPEEFSAHIEKSVPGYRDGHWIVEAIAPNFVRPATRVIEAGTSRGDLFVRLCALSQSVADVRVCGFDLEASMVRATAARSADFPFAEVEVADAETYDYAGASLVVMYYTLQFLNAEAKSRCLARIYSGMSEGGALIIFEKTLYPTALGQDIGNLGYLNFKAAQGFTSDEILDKSNSLRGVLHSEDRDRLAERLRTAGFPEPIQLFKYLAFDGYITVKGG